MSALIGPAKAARILGEKLIRMTELMPMEALAEKMLLRAIGAAHVKAANRMEQEMREEAQRS